jgi:hypothetical protein
MINEVTRRPDGPYLIESSPAYGKRRACLLLQRLAMLPVTGAELGWLTCA